MIGLNNVAKRVRASGTLRACSSRQQTRSASMSFGWLLLVPALMVAGHASAQSCGVAEMPLALGFTGGEQTATVPAGVRSLTVYLSGAQGGVGRSGAGTIGGSPNSPGGTGGLGGRVRGTLAVTPGATLSIWVGGQGSQAVNAGGIGQGVDGIGGGGTDLRVGGNGIGNRVGIAGGGGGGGNAGWSTANVIAGGAGGVGGGGTGGAGATVPGGTGPFGGGGGSVGIGGIAGNGCGGFPATAGNAANGNGGDSNNFSGSFVGAGFGGGGGGGATIGAGGGGAGVGTTGCQQNWNGGGGGGAGGASGATGLTAVTINNGVQAGNGAALICFAATEFAVGGTASGQTGAVTLQLAATNPASSQQTVVAAGAGTFVFPTRLPQGANWNVSVLSAPPGQVCSVNPSSGAAISADVTNVALTCATVTTTITPPTLPNGAFDVAYSQALGASSANGGVGPYTFSVSAGALPAGLSLSSAGVLLGTPTATGSFNFTVQATSSNGFSGTQAYTVAIAQAPQAITAFAATPASPVYAPDGTFAVSATGGASGNPVVFASTSPAVCTVAGSTVTMLAAGACALTADQAGNANYGAAPQAALSVTIGGGSQVITNFVANPATPVYVPGGSFTVSATPGPSTSPIVFAATTAAVCTVSGSTVTMLTAGTCSLTADQAADANYAAAPQVTLDVVIGAATQAITDFAANPAAPVFTVGGTFTVSASGGASGNPVVFASTSPTICTVSGSTVTMLGTGTCSLTADQAGNTSYSAAPQVTLQVLIGGATPDLAWIDDLVKTLGETAFDLPDPSSDSGGAFTFTSSNAAVATVSGRRVTIVGAGVATLVATQAAAGNYLQASVSATLTVADRPDPTRDPSVVGGLQAQVDASLRFASAQQSNVQDRLRQQRFASANSSSNGLSVSRSDGFSGGVSVSAGQVAPIDGARLPKGLGIWTAGSVTSGQRDANGRSDGFDFSSDGVTVGADWRFNDRFLFGVAGGLGWNDTDLDDARSRLDAKQRALSLYGLWRAAERWFVDGIVGVGQLDFDLRRYSAVVDATGTARRDGDQVYGSLTVGYEHGTASATGMLLTGYGHLDASRTTLDSYRERGLDNYDLRYGEQTVDDSGASLGLEGSFRVVSAHDNVFRPYWMLEYRASLESSSDVRLNYVILPATNDYLLGLRGYGDNALTYGAGMDMEMTSGWRVSLLMRRQNGSGQDPSTSVGLLLSYSPTAPSPSVTAPTAQNVMTQMDGRVANDTGTGGGATVSSGVPVTGH